MTNCHFLQVGAHNLGILITTAHKGFWGQEERARQSQVSVPGTYVKLNK